MLDLLEPCPTPAALPNQPGANQLAKGCRESPDGGHNQSDPGREDFLYSFKALYADVPLILGRVCAMIEGEKIQVPELEKPEDR